jgi:hypothetical protein
MDMPQAQLTHRFVGDAIKSRDLSFILLCAIVRTIDVEWAEKTNRNKGDFYKMVSNLVHFLWVSNSYPISSSASLLLLDELTRPRWIRGNSAGHCQSGGLSRL